MNSVEEEIESYFNDAISSDTKNKNVGVFTVKDIEENNTNPGYKIEILESKDENESVELKCIPEKSYYSDLGEKYILNFKFTTNKSKRAAVWQHFTLFEVYYVTTNDKNKSDINILRQRYSHRAICMICYNVQREKVNKYGNDIMDSVNSISSNEINNNSLNAYTTPMRTNSSCIINSTSSYKSISNYNRSHINRITADNSNINLEDITCHYPESKSTTNLSRHLETHGIFRTDAMQVTNELTTSSNSKTIKSKNIFICIN